MSDLKSKLPDLNELSSMAGKLYNDVKVSVLEIIDDYKKKHPDDVNEPQTDTPKPDIEIKAEKPEDIDDVEKK
jgi:hypothetical protein